MIYFNNFDLLKEREQLHNTCNSQTQTLWKVKLEKESSEIKRSIILERDKNTWEKKNIMISNTFSETAFNMTESASSSTQILIQMQTCIEQLEEQCWQQNLKIDKPDQFDETKEKLRQWLVQMNVHMSAQFYQLRTKKNKVMLAISYLISKTAD